MLVTVLTQLSTLCTLNSDRSLSENYFCWHINTFKNVPAELRRKLSHAFFKSYKIYGYVLPFLSLLNILRDINMIFQTGVKVSFPLALP